MFLSQNKSYKRKGQKCSYDSIILEWNQTPFSHTIQDIKRASLQAALRLTVVFPFIQVFCPKYISVKEIFWLKSPTVIFDQYSFAEVRYVCVMKMGGGFIGSACWKDLFYWHLSRLLHLLTTFVVFNKFVFTDYKFYVNWFVTFICFFNSKVLIVDKKVKLDV